MKECRNKTINLVYICELIKLEISCVSYIHLDGSREKPLNRRPQGTFPEDKWNIGISSRFCSSLPDFVFI